MLSVLLHPGYGGLPGRHAPRTWRVRPTASPRPLRALGSKTHHAEFEGRRPRLTVLGDALHVLAVFCMLNQRAAVGTSSSRWEGNSLPNSLQRGFSQDLEALHIVSTWVAALFVAGGVVPFRLACEAKLLCLGSLFLLTQGARYAHNAELLV